MKRPKAFFEKKKQNCCKVENSLQFWQIVILKPIGFDWMLYTIDTHLSQQIEGSHLPTVFRP